jgi:hypothetical protein
MHNYLLLPSIRRPKVLKVRKPYFQLSDEEKGIIIGMKNKNASYREIGLHLGRDHSSVRRFYDKYEQSGDSSRSDGSGRPHKLKERDMRHVKITATNDPFISLAKIRDDLNLGYVCPRTIARALSGYCGICSHWSKRKPFISAANKKKRLQWAKEHRHWTINEWRNIVWTDESPFVLRYQGPKRVLRRECERYNERFMLGTVKHDKKINLWGAFSYNGVGHLHQIGGIMDAKIFKQILIHHLVPSMQALHPNGEGIFQQDNDPKHTSALVQDYIRSKGIKVLPWPSQSPDLNPIENLWHMMDYKMRARKPQNEQQLYECCLES